MIKRYYAQMYTCLQSLCPNVHLSAIIVSSTGEEYGDGDGSRTELDSHANMCVVGKHCYILANSGRTIEVNPFSPDYAATTAPRLVDAAVLYEHPYTDERYILVILNAIFVPSMEHNLIPPFIMREAGIIVNDVPKIHMESPGDEDHSIYFKDHDVRIHLRLNGIFSYFPSGKPSLEDIHSLAENALLLTPLGQWNPHHDSYAQNEDNMMDWEGKMIEEKYRERILLEEIPEDPVVSVADVSAVEVERQDVVAAMSQLRLSQESARVMTERGSTDDDLLTIQPVLDPQFLASSLDVREQLAIFAMSLGTTTPWKEDVLFPHIDMSEVDDSFAANIEAFDIGELDFDDIMASGVNARSHIKGVTPEHLSKIWRIDHDTAVRTINANTQHCVRPEVPNLSRNYPTNDRMLRYRRINQHFFMDTFFATKEAGKSSRGYTMCQLFVTDKGFVYVVLMKSKSEVIHAMKAFAKEVGAPDAIIHDASGEQTSTEMKAFCRQIGTTLRVIEKGTPWANRAELYVGIIKAATRKDMLESNCPIVFWDYCVERCARINNLTAKDLFQLEGNTPHFSVYGEQGDISNVCMLGFYEFCYYVEPASKWPEQRECLGRALGPAKGEGNEMCQWILKANGEVVPRRTYRPLTPAEWNSEEQKAKRAKYNALIELRWGSPMEPPKQEEPESDTFIPYEDDDEDERFIKPVDDPVDANGRAINLQPVYDTLIKAELMLPHDGLQRPARVRGRSTNSDGSLTGTYNDNPLMNTMTYEVEFDDGAVKEYAANVIAENILMQVDEEGFTLTHLDSILDYRKNDDALDSDEGRTINKRGERRLRKTTRGWDLLFQYTDGSVQWMPLSEAKETYPVDVAEFAKAHGIHTEPAFAWWVPYTLKKRHAIVSNVRGRTRKLTHKYGIEIPRDLDHVTELDRKNGNDLWDASVKKEMANSGVAFKILEPDLGEKVPPGWNKQTGHLVWDVKLTGERKARYVLDGHKTPDAESHISTFAGVVSRESVRIALTYAALNDLDVCAADIRNAYLQAPSSQKDYIICGPEFGLENVGKPALITRALYGGKFAGRDFRNHLRDCMSNLGFKPCLADPDVWMRRATKPEGGDYWEYVLLYTDDCLAISHRAEAILRNEIGRYFMLKEESIGEPDIYLGGKLRKVDLDNGATAWAFSSSKYVRAAVKNVETKIMKEGKKLPKTCDTPMSTEYRPEVNVSPELSSDEASYFQSLIGVLRWIVELGRVDICCELSMLSSHLALPREGHLEQVY